MKSYFKDGMNWIKLIAGILAFGVLLYFILGEMFLPDEGDTVQYRCSKFNTGWVWEQEDGNCVPVKIPGKCDVGRNEKVTIKTVLPKEIEPKTYLCFLSSKQEMEIYVEDELRQEYSTKDTRLWGRTSAVAYVFLELHKEDAGKTVSVTHWTDSHNAGRLNSVYYGDRMGIWYHFASQSGTGFLIAIITMVLGFISIVISVALHICYRKRIRLLYLGWCVLAGACWIIMNSSLRQLIFSNFSVISDMAFLIIMIMPVPFILYFNDVQNNRYRKWYILCAVLSEIGFVVLTLLHILNYRDFADTILIMAGNNILVMGLLVVSIAADVIKGYVKEYSLEAAGIISMCCAVGIQLVLYFTKGSTFNGVAMAFGLIVLLVIAVKSTTNDILDMEREKQQALFASKTKAQFLANMSHEIRTPINAILGMNAMVLREGKDSRIKEYALDIQNAGQNLLMIVNEILDLSKVESGKLELVPAEYDFSSIIHDIANMVSIKAKDKGLELKVTVNPKLPARLYGDEMRLRQILTNLLNNAVKYTEKGSVSLVADGVVSGEYVDLRFLVEDTGQGIKEEDISKLFEEYKRIEEKKNRSIEGTGLGLNITKRLLELMDSRLEVESTYGEGSKFSFVLKQKITDSEPVGDLEERIRRLSQEYEYTVSFVAPEAHILVVDDNPVNLKVFTSLLKETRINIDTASEGPECLELVRENPYDIIFLDHMMPGMDGVEVLHRIRELKEMPDFPCKDTPVVVLTANAVSGAKEMYLSEGFHDFLSKPIDSVKMEQMIQHLLPQEKVRPFQVSDKEKTVDASLDENTGELPFVDGIDWEYAKRHLPDFQGLQEMVELFYRMIDTEADSLTAFWEDGDLDNYRIKVHAMKSSAFIIGAITVGGMAKVLEYAARDGDTDTIHRMTPVFLKEWRTYKEKLKPCVEGQEETVRPEKKMEDRSVLFAYLEMIRTAMAEMDIDKLDRTVSLLKEYVYPPEADALINSLSDAVVNLDEEKVDGIVNDILRLYK